MKFLLQRLLRTLLLLLGLSVLCFLFTEMAPGSFFDEMRLNPQISPETIALLRSRYGLDQPLPIRYVRWTLAAAHGDFGYSLAYDAPVGKLLLPRAKNTLLLTSVATVLSWILALPLGIWSASRRGRLIDRVIGTGTSVVISVPEIVMAIALLALAVRFRLGPVGGMMSLSLEDQSLYERIGDVCAHMMLPVSILVLGSAAIIERHVRAGVLEVLDSACIQAARGLGIGRMRLLVYHVLPLAANSAISLLGFSLAGLLGGSLLVEAITGWPGLGPLILEATLSRDLYVVIGGVMLSGVFMLGGNFVADVLLLACDPRIRSGESNEA
ncbi:MAG TPA: ABC transporter permease [Candidatus Aquilonibacter sp.]|nr:ABC transporter permease [Candidatus Aquilonibacter sp.]